MLEKLPPPKEPALDPREELSALKSLLQELEHARDEAIHTASSPEAAKAALLRAKNLMAELEVRRAALLTELHPLERELNLEAQYESQKKILEDTHVLERLSSGDMGVHGIDNKEYPFPSYEEISGRIREKKELLSHKAEQGFTKLLIVPIGMSLDKLRERYKVTILKHYVDMPDPQDPTRRIPDPQKTKLFATRSTSSGQAKADPKDPDLPLELDTNDPLYTWSEYTNADVDQKLIYDIKSYPPKDVNNNRLPYDTLRDGGVTKHDLIGSEGAYRIPLIEDLPNIPREGQGKEVGHRKQLEANKTPEEYLIMVGQDIYKNESNMAPEDNLIYAITHLEETNQVIDDFGGKGTISYQIGGYFKSHRVPVACWRREYRQASLGGYAPDYRDENFGVRSSVRV